MKKFGQHFKTFWNKSNFWHLAKSISYRIYSSAITYLIAFTFTQNAANSLKISLIDFGVKIFTYFIHEKIWERFLKK
jgi:uncharacterized membrane protein